MEILNYILIGIIQGLTEFLPVSSSGHLVLFENLINIKDIIDNHFLNVVVHFGTMIAVIIVFRIKIWSLIKEFFTFPFTVKRIGFKEAVNRPDFKFVIAIIIGSIPTAIIGFILKDWIKSIEHNLLFVAFMFLITSIILFLSRVFESIRKNVTEKDSDVSIFKAIIIGIVQGIATLPGISRSGSTITAGVGLKIDRETAANFSFILCLPAIFGATLLEFIGLLKGGIGSINLIGIILAFTSALTLGWISLVVLMRFIKRGKFFYFGFYVLAISIVCFVLYFVR